ncbi:MAG: VanW family protein [Oscillospiraceae bacterium]|nr:VanW family protein [Oscillospiraceae bacterium]
MRNVILSVIAGAIISCLGTYYYIYRTVNDFNDFIYPGVSINGKEIPKITKEELENQLKEEYLKPVAAKTIIIRAEAKNYALSFSDLNPEYNINEISDEAYNYKKNENLLNKYFRITNLFSKGEKIELSLDYSFDDSAIIPLVDKIAADIYRDPVDATFKLENGTLIVTDDIKGAELNKDELIDELKEIAKDPNAQNLNVQAPINFKTAKITGDVLRRINGVMATFTTSDSSYVRLVNMGIAAKEINGTMVFPGQEFSFNGSRENPSPDKGYLESYAYIDNKSVLDYGGGICQLSTTLYGALLRANIMPTERQPHMMPIWYVPMGLDATVYYGVVDLKFVNTYDAPIYIESYLVGENLTVTIYGDKTLMNGLTYEPYSTLNGPLSANAYLNTIDSAGNVINTEYLHTDNYNDH